MRSSRRGGPLILLIAALADSGRRARLPVDDPPRVQRMRRLPRRSLGRGAAHRLRAGAVRSPDGDPVERREVRGGEPHRGLRLRALQASRSGCSSDSATGEVSWSPARPPTTPPASSRAPPPIADGSTWWRTSGPGCASAASAPRAASDGCPTPASAMSVTSKDKNNIVSREFWAGWELGDEAGLVRAGRDQSPLRAAERRAHRLGPLGHPHRHQRGPAVRRRRSCSPARRCAGRSWPSPATTR